MTAKIIAVANQKGGCGKTTVTMVVAAGLWARGLRVLVVDADRQGSASTWSANAPPSVPFPARVCNLAHAGKALPSEVQKFAEDVDVILIDCPPSVDSPLPQAALLISDLLLVPLLPSPADVAAAASFFALVEQAEGLNPGLQKRIVPNMVQRTALADSFKKSFESLPLARTATELTLRVSYREAMALGASIESLPASAKRAQDEVKRLVAEVVALLDIGSLGRPLSVLKAAVKGPRKPARPAKAKAAPRKSRAKKSARKSVARAS
ncbi:MAG: ParA family protein [Deltaproteobacteria bacterium]|nr:ParA family protein [Deltaproteobacteria bacterium]